MSERIEQTELDWVWLAGYIEGKKGLGSYLRNDRTYYAMDITCQDLGLLQWMSLTYNLPKPFFLPRNNSNRIAIRSKPDLIRVLTGILPHLKSTHRQTCREFVDALTQ